MARPGLYDELAKRNLLEQGRSITLGDGTYDQKADLLDQLLARVGSTFNVTARAVFILYRRLKEAPDTDTPPGKAVDADEARESRDHSNTQSNTPSPRPAGKRGAPFGNKNGVGNKNAVGNKGGGAPRGNDNRTTTGERRNPMLHDVSPERLALVARTPDMSPVEVLWQSIQVHQLAIADMTRQIEAIEQSTKRWWWLGSTYTRQEGDGEIMGTGRISQRKRVPREEALKTMIEARARVQGKLDGALEKLHKMLQDKEGKRKRGLADLLAAMRRGGDDD